MLHQKKRPDGRFFMYNLSMSEKFVLYLAGGGMSGVFGAGVVTAMQEYDLYEKIDRVYACSAGAINAAYFLTKNTKIGSSIYYEDLTKDFIHYGHVIPGAMQRLIKGPILPEDPYTYKNAMMVRKLFEVMGSNKLLNINDLVNQPIPFIVKVLNQKNMKIEYINIKKVDPTKLLKAAICAPPYTFEFEKINGCRMIDSNICEVIALDELLNICGNKKIVIVLNRPVRNIIINKIACFFEGLVASWQYGKEYFYFPFEREKQFRKDFKKAQNLNNILLIYPKSDKVANAKSIKKDVLLHSYEHGKESASAIMKFVK
jgi:predicted patatin/cPLA2 family phospholipase